MERTKSICPGRTKERIRRHPERRSRHPRGDKTTSHAIDHVLKRTKDVHCVGVPNINISQLGQLIERFFRYKTLPVQGIDSYREEDTFMG